MIELFFFGGHSAFKKLSIFLTPRIFFPLTYRGVSQRDEEFKARSQVEDWGKLDLEGLLSKLAAKSQCSQPVQARAQASGGSCSSGSCSRQWRRVGGVRDDRLRYDRRPSRADGAAATLASAETWKFPLPTFPFQVTPLASHEEP